MSGQVQKKQVSDTAPDGGWGWVVVFASFMLHVFADGVIFSFGVYHRELVKYFRSSEAATSLIASILVGFTLCVGPVSSVLVNRFGCRAVAAGGGLIGAMGIMSSAFATNIPTLQATIGVIGGTGLGLIYLPATVAVTSYFRRRRAMATGMAVCGSGIGTFLMAPLTQWLVGEYGWRGAMAISGALTLHCGVFGLLFRPPPRTPTCCTQHKSADKARSQSLGGDANCYAKLPAYQYALGYNPRKFGSEDDALHKESLPRESHCNGNTNSLEEKISEVKPLMLGIRKLPSAEIQAPPPDNTSMFDFSLFREPIFLIFALSNFCTSLGFNVPFVYIVSHAEAKGIPKTTGSYLLSVIGIANTSGRIILGYIFDKKSINRQWIYNICLVVGGISTGLSTFCSNMTGFIMYAITFGFTVGAYTGLTSVIVVDLLGLEKLSNVFGFLLLFQGIANLLGPPITGWLFDLSKSYTPGFLVAGTVICTSGLILFALPVIQRCSSKQKQARLTPRGNPSLP